MKIYIAAQYHRKEEMCHVARILKQCGHEVTSSWLKEKYHPDTKMVALSPDELRYTAETDIIDIMECDVILLFSNDPYIPDVRGGHNVELGFALGSEKRICVIGPCENIFHYLKKVEHFNDLGEFLARNGGF